MARSRKIEVQILGDSRSLERAFSRSSRSAKGFSTSLGGTTRHIARNLGLVGAAAIGLGTVAVRSFAKFEQSMDRVVGLAGGARLQVEKFSEEILKLGPTVAKGPQELGDALYFVASAGIAASKQMGVVTEAARASTAGLGDTMTVADAMTSAMNAYGVANLSAARSADVLAATVREGKGEAAAFAPVIGTVTSLAAELGVRFEEVGAALAAQTRLGVKAEIASVQLQAVFSGLLKASPKVDRAFKKMGLSQAGLRKQLAGKGLLSVLKTLKERFAGNTAAMAEAFPSIRALRGLFGLVGKQGASVEAIFKRMKNSTGALDTAFNAVSEGSAFAFQQTMSSLAVTGIQLGALLAPVAKRLAQGASAAFRVVNDFLGKLRKAKTIRAKLDVVWEGIKGATVGVTDALGRAIEKIDFKAVWAKARGIADGLQEQLERTDFGVVGRRIGEAFVDAVKVAVPAAKEMAERINRAVKAIDFEALGRELGPALATAVVVAFTTLMDPAFWVKNWDLALSVALVAFGGPIGKLAGKITPLFAKLGERAVLAIAGGMERLSSRLGAILLAGLLRLPALAARALAPLTRLVSKVFGKLGKLGRFTVKVLGLTAVINAVVGFGRKVGRVFTDLGHTIGDALDRAFDFMKKRALKAALEIVEPFTHLPRWLGGGTFQDLKTEWSATLKAMETSASTTTREIQNAIDNVHGKTVVVRVVSEGGKGDVHDRNDPVTGGKKKPTAKPAVAEAKLEEGAAQEAAAARKRAARLAAAHAKSVEKALEKARDAFAILFGRLDLKLDRAAVTKSFDDDLAVLREQEEAVQAQIKVEGRTLDLERQLFDIEQQRLDVARQQREAQASRRKGKQFQALGLTSTGEERTPGAGALRKKASTLAQQIKGTILDTAKTRNTLAQIGKVLSGKFGAVGKEVRASILQMLNDIGQALEGGGQKGPLTKFKKRGVDSLLDGLGLTAEQVKEIRQRMSQRGAGGTMPNRGTAAFGFAVPTGSSTTAPTIIHTHVHVDGREVARSTTRHQQKTRGRTAAQRRGVRPGV